MCHLSHSYHSGACLYFTFAFVLDEGRDELEQYDAVKGAIQQAFMDAGATLVPPPRRGHRARARGWSRIVSAEGVALMAGLFATADPGNRLNPDKVLRREK